jgi:ADP-ribose pyrophosphatase YjhB (NUDIX family)
MAASPIDDIFTHERDYLHNVSIDNVIFGYHGKELKVLLQQPFEAGKWTVTGGYIRRTESIEGAAARIAIARTGLKDLFLQQFRAFGHPRRTAENGFTAAQLSKLTGAEVPPNAWIFDYFVSLAFYTLTEFSKVEVTKSPIEADCAWWPVSDLPPLLFDHAEIIREALVAMRLHIAHFPIGYQLLETKFTLPEIRSLYETILGRPLDDRNFAKKLMATGILVKLEETRKIGAHRSPFLYRFNKAKYEEALKTGIELAF